MRAKLFNMCCLLASLVLRPFARLDFAEAELAIPDYQRTGLLVASNHRSVADVLIGLVLFRRWDITPRIMVKATYFQVPVVGTLLRVIRAIPTGRENAREAISSALTTLTGGGVVAIAPEGRLTPMAQRLNGVGHLQSGVGRLAIELGTPILAIGLAHTDVLWPLGRRIPRIPKQLARRPTVYVAATQLDVAAGASVGDVMAGLREVMERVVRIAESRGDGSEDRESPSAWERS